MAFTVLLKTAPYILDNCGASWPKYLNTLYLKHKMGQWLMMHYGFSLHSD